MDTLNMRRVEVKKGDFVWREEVEVEVVFEKKVTPFGNSKVDVPKRYIGWRAYVIVVRD